MGTVPFLLSPRRVIVQDQQDDTFFTSIVTGPVVTGPVQQAIPDKAKAVHTGKGGISGINMTTPIVVSPSPIPVASPPAPSPVNAGGGFIPGAESPTTQDEINPCMQQYIDQYGMLPKFTDDKGVEIRVEDLEFDQACKPYRKEADAKTLTAPGKKKINWVPWAIAGGLGILTIIAIRNRKKANA